MLQARLRGPGDGVVHKTHTLSPPPPNFLCQFVILIFTICETLAFIKPLHDVTTMRHTRKYLITC